MSKQYAGTGWLAAGSLAALTAALVFAAPTAAGELPAQDPLLAAEPAASGVPLMLVFDTSTSMSESGDDGVVRLDGAKAAAIDVIYGLPTSTKVGVWAYPNDGGCGPGEGLLEVTNLDISGLTPKIQQLQPNGDTPTAAALRAATDALKSQGFTAGTIVLASDGEANCGADPCVVAQEIVDEGFDLTVNPTGINISDEGRTQLECIANATGGRYYDAANALELRDSILASSQPALTLETTGMTGTARSGSRTVISATVSNTSPSVIAQDVTLSLTFPSLGGGLQLTALPPILRVGNLPPGASLTRYWTVSTGDPGTAYPRLLAQTTTGQKVEVEGELTITSSPATLGEAGPILADARRIAILGDSYSSGEGAAIGPDPGTYLKNGTRADGCHRSLNTYGLSLYGIIDGDAVIACSGAVAAEYEASNADRDRKAQANYLRGLLRNQETRPDVVLLTFGGNDIGFSGVVKKCALPGDCTISQIRRPFTEEEQNQCLVEFVHTPGNTPSCRPRYELWTQTKLDEATQLELADIYMAIATDIGDATPEGAAPVPIVVLPYPQIVTNTLGGGCSHLSLRERQFGAAILGLLNQSIEQGVSKARSDGALVYYARDVTQAVLPGHTACAPDLSQRYINALSFSDPLTPNEIGQLAPDCVTAAATRTLVPTLRCGQEYVSQVGDQAQQLMHPNTPGYRAVTNSLVDWSRLPDVTNTWRQDQQRAQPTSPLIDWTMPIAWGPTTEIDFLQGSPLNPQTLPAGTDLRVTADGFAPNSEVRIVVRSTPTALGVRTADEGGRVAASVTLPATVTPGNHHLTVEGTDTEGAPVLLAVPLVVTPATPLWLMIVAVSAILFLTMGAVLGVRNRQERAEA